MDWSATQRILFLLLFLKTIDSARILGIFPHIGKSHFDVFEPLLKQLATRGHELTVASHFPQKVKLSNYTDIVLKQESAEISSTEGVNITEFLEKKEFGTDKMIIEWSFKLCENIASDSRLQNLVKSGGKFDLLISELFASDCYLAYAHALQVPHIGLSSHVLMPWTGDRFGNPDHPAYIPNLFSFFSSKMNFYERLCNTVLVTWRKLLYYYKSDIPSQQILSKHFSNLPPLHELKRNTSLVLTNTHFSVHHVRPLVPGVVEAAGIHVRKPSILPEDLERFMSGAEHGVVYFNMGSMMRAETCPEDKKLAFIEAFSVIPQRVLWKWEGEIPNLPPNILTRKWMPQIDVLSHSKTVLYIGHGGNLGLIEAASKGVPMISIPMYGDQFNNAKSAENKGMAVLLQFEEITTQKILAALKTVLNDPRYKENAKQVSRAFNDRPMSPLDTAVYWTEYVIRHKGAPHLRSAAVDLPLYQYLLLDVIAVIAIGIFVTLTILYIVIKRLILFVGRKGKTKTD